MAGSRLTDDFYVYHQDTRCPLGDTKFLYAEVMPAATFYAVRSALLINSFLVPNINYLV